VIPGYDIIKDSLGVLASKGLVFKSLGASLLKNNNIWRVETFRRNVSTIRCILTAMAIAI
jgi:hypothetical protein